MNEKGLPDGVRQGVAKAPGEKQEERARAELVRTAFGQVGYDLEKLTVEEQARLLASMALLLNCDRRVVSILEGAGQTGRQG